MTLVGYKMRKKNIETHLVLRNIEQNDRTHSSCEMLLVDRSLSADDGDVSSAFASNAVLGVDKTCLSQFGLGKGFWCELRLEIDLFDANEFDIGVVEVDGVEVFCFALSGVDVIALGGVDFGDDVRF